MKKKLLLNLLLLVALAVVSSIVSNLSAEEIQLPDDGRQFAVIIITHDDWRQRPNERMVMSWFYGGDKDLTNFASAAKVFHYTESDPVYKAKFRKPYGDAYPIIAVQDWDGAAIPTLTGRNMPRSPEATAKYIKRWLKKLRPLRSARQIRSPKDPGQNIQNCVDGLCKKPTPRKTRQRRGLFGRRNRDGTDGTDDEPPLDESAGPLVFPDYKAPIPSFDEVEPVETIVLATIEEPDIPVESTTAGRDDEAKVDVPVPKAITTELLAVIGAAVTSVVGFAIKAMA